MSFTILEDSKLRPELFRWSGAIDRPTLDQWLAERPLWLPEDLMLFISETGGGDLFESETILSPSGDVALGDELESANQFHHASGLSENYLLFHRGLGFSAVTRDGRYVWLSDFYTEREHYPSFEDWYCRLIRNEFAIRYGLPA